MLHHHTLALLQLVVGRGRADVDGLANHALELVVLERTVVEGGGQSEAVLHEGHLSGAVAAVHGAHLGHRHVALVDHEQEVVREVIEQTEGALTGLSTVEVAAVVLNAAAEAQFPHHLEIVRGAFLEALPFNEPPLLIEPLDLLHHVLLDLPDALLQGVLAGHEQVGRIDTQRLEGVEDGSVFRVNGLDALDLIAPEVKANGVIGVSEEHVDHVSIDAKGATAEVAAGAVVEAFHQAVKDGVAADHLADLDLDDTLVEFHRVADAVDAADGRHDDDVAATAEQGGRGGQAQLLDLLVDGEVLLDVGAAGRDVRLGLIVVVVADEVLHEVVREELLEFAVELGSEGLVVAQDQRRPLGLLDDVGNGEGLARPGHAQQGLVGHPGVHALHQLADGLRLVASRLEFTVELERGHRGKSGTKKGGSAPFCFVSSRLGGKSYSATTSKAISATTSLWSFTLAV